MALTAALRLNFYSVVPTFGTEGNWIVLLGEKNRRAYEHMWKKGCSTKSSTGSICYHSSLLSIIFTMFSCDTSIFLETFLLLLRFL